MSLRITEEEKHAYFIFKRLSPNAHVPRRMTSGAAGFDLCSAQNVTIGPQETVLVKTDLAFNLPHGCYGRICERSSVALKKIVVGGGTIDPDYKGNVGIIMHNISPTETFRVKKGDRIAQLVLERHMYCPIIYEATTDGIKPMIYEGREKERGEKGFGSTGEK